MQNGYANLNGNARAIAELTELLVRADIEAKLYEVLPGRTPYSYPMSLSDEIQERLAAMPEDDRAVVLNLRTVGRQGIHWQTWLKQHIELFPQDAADLFLLQEHFGGSKSSGKGGQVSAFVLQNYGAYDRPWKMHHDWHLRPPKMLGQK